MTNPKHTSSYLVEAVAARYDFDGYGWRYIDSGSGSDWLTRHLDAELLYTVEAADRIEALEAEVERLREELAAAYVDQSGTVQHASDCATSNAPAMKPGPCDCAALGEKQ